MSCGATLAMNEAEQILQLLIMISYAFFISYCITVIGRIVSTND